MLDRETEEEVSLGLGHLLPAFPRRGMRIDRDWLAARQNTPTGSALCGAAEDHQQPQQSLPYLFELLLQPVVRRRCQQVRSLLPQVLTGADDVAGIADPGCLLEGPAVGLDDDILEIVETGVVAARHIDEGAEVLVRVERVADDHAVIVDRVTVAGRKPRSLAVAE